MTSPRFPSTVPICTSTDEKNSVYQDAKDNQRPFLAVTNEEAMPGWRVFYDMTPTGDGRVEWYELSESALDDLKEHHERFKQRIEQDSFIEGCATDEGGLHGLSKSDAEDLADRFTGFVWDMDCWVVVEPGQAFDGQ